MIGGLVAFLLAQILGVGWAHLSPLEVFQFFPLELFITLFSVTLLIKVAEESGCFTQLTYACIRLCGARQRMLPILIFAISALISAGGAGNISATALMAPIALSIAGSIGLDAFLMTLMVVGGANASVMSPFAPTGLIARSLIDEFLGTQAKGLGGMLFVICFIVIGLVHFLGFLVLGGARWLRNSKSIQTIKVNTDTAALWSRPQVVTLGILGLFFVLNIMFGVEKFRIFFPTSVQALGGDIGILALMCLSLMVALRVGSLATAARGVPWGLIILICGMATLISMIEKAAGFGGISQMTALVGSSWQLVLIVSFFSATLSVFSSSSGVVMPLLLSMIPSFVAGGFLGSLPLLVASIIISSHLVDCSPFSTLGALSIASCKDGDAGSKQLFRKLRNWGLAMVFVGSIISTLAFSGLFRAHS